MKGLEKGLFLAQSVVIGDVAYHLLDVIDEACGFHHGDLFPVLEGPIGESLLDRTDPGIVLPLFLEEADGVPEPIAEGVDRPFVMKQELGGHRFPTEEVNAFVQVGSQIEVGGHFPDRLPRFIEDLEGDHVVDPVGREVVVFVITKEVVTAIVADQVIRGNPEDLAIAVLPPHLLAAVIAVAPILEGDHLLLGDGLVDDFDVVEEVDLGVPSGQGVAIDQVGIVLPLVLAAEAGQSFREVLALGRFDVFRGEYGVDQITDLADVKDGVVEIDPFLGLLDFEAQVLEELEVGPDGLPFDGKAVFAFQGVDDLLLPQGMVLVAIGEEDIEETKGKGLGGDLVFTAPFET